MADSPSGSMAGYNFIELIKKNKDKIKILVSAIGAYLTSVASGIKDPSLNTLVASGIGVVIYIVAAAVDFYLTENPT
jgi:hypothetical protein